MYDKIIICYGGELSSDVAESLEPRLSSTLSSSSISKLSMDNTKGIKALIEENNKTLVLFIVQTIENAQPPESAGACVRFFKRKTHAEDLLKDKFHFSVLGLGDSNLLLNRQTTTANDCNQVAQELDKRLKALQATSIYDLGLSDERTGMTEVEPWILGLFKLLESS